MSLGLPHARRCKSGIPSQFTRFSCHTVDRLVAGRTGETPKPVCLFIDRLA